MNNNKDTYKTGPAENSKPDLTPLEIEVTQNNGTEPPFNNKYWNFFQEGIYVDITNGEPLFSSKDKFESNCGWPSFTKPIQKERVQYKVDSSYGMRRIEVRSQSGNIHLGHVFNDGPEVHGGLRYCINSAALRFVPKDQMHQAGYDTYLQFL